MLLNPDFQIRRCAPGLAALLVCLVLLRPPLACGQAATPEGQLFWANGQSLPGQLLDAEGDKLRWRSSLFVDPLILNANYLATVAFARGNAPDASPESFRVVLRNGDVMYANLERISKDHVVLKSDRHGLIELDRAAVRSLRRVDSEALIYLGPNGTAGWSSLNNSIPADNWSINPEGQLNTRRTRGELFREIKIPGQAELEVSLTASNMPQFLMAFGDQANRTVRLETWADELVALSGDDFEPILTMDANTRQVDLRLYWNQNSGELSVFSKTGKKLGAIAGAKPAGSRFGFYLQNKGTDLSLRSVRVSRWNGQPPREVRAGQSRVHLADGKIIYGQISDFAAGDGNLVVADSEQGSVPIEQVSSVHLTDAANAPSSELVQLMYFDGSLLTGEVTRIEDGKIGLKTSHASQPIVSSLIGARKLAFRPQGPPPADGPDQLFHDGGLSRGTLTGGDRAGAAILWRPVGGLNASPLAAGCKARFVRGKPAEDRPGYEASKYPDLLFLVSRDVVPCTVKSIDEKFVHLETAFGDTRQIAHERVQALELTEEAQQNQTGFEGAGWQIYAADEDAVQHKGQRVTFKGKGGFGHRSILRGEELLFQMRWDRRKPAFLTLRLFAPDLERSNGSTELGFYCTGDQLRVATQNRGQLSFGNVLGRAELGRAQVRVSVEKQSLHVTVNDQKVYSTGLGAAPRRGTGIMFSTAIPNMMSGRVSGEVTVSNLQMRRVSRIVASRQFVDAETKAHALTIPRFRKQNPFTHILLAQNGDLLRGRLHGLNDNKIKFQSRLDDFTFDRNLIGAIVWLHETAVDAKEAEADAAQPAANSAPANAAPVAAVPRDPGPNANEPNNVAQAQSDEAQPNEAQPNEAGTEVATTVDEQDEAGPLVRVLLAGGEIVVIRPEKMTDEFLIGHSEPLGTCRIPVAAIRELQVGGFGPLDDAIGYADWQLRPAEEPKFAGTGGNPSAAQPGGELVGTQAKDFVLATLDGKEFRLSDHADKVIVLDFWATWCGPCVRAMPEYLRVLDEFDSDEVLFVGVNQAEPAQTIKDFLANREWKMQVAMDSNQQIARQFAVEGIPHTVVVGKGGKVAWVHVGFRPGVEQELKDAVSKLAAPKKDDDAAGS